MIQLKNGFKLGGQRITSDQSGRAYWPINVSQTPQITPTMEDTLNDTEPQKIPESDEGDQSQVDSVAQAELQPQGATAANPTMPM